MTSVLTPYAGAITAGNATLVQSLNLYIPSTYAWIDEWKTTPSLITPVNRRTNFWSSECVLDGRYPVLVWDHQFKIYFQPMTVASSWITDFYNFFQLFTRTSSSINGTPLNLSINDGNSLTSVRVYLGPGYIEDFSLEDPDSFLKSAGGFVNIKACCTNIPSHVF